MTEETPKPGDIVVSATSTTAQLTSALRAFLVALGSALATRGIIDGSLVEPTVGFALIAVPIAWAQLSVWLKHQKMKALAESSPKGFVK